MAEVTLSLGLFGQPQLVCPFRQGLETQRYHARQGHLRFEPLSSGFSLYHPYRRCAHPHGGLYLGLWPFVQLELEPQRLNLSLAEPVHLTLTLFARSRLEQTALRLGYPHTWPSLLRSCCQLWPS